MGMSLPGGREEIRRYKAQGTRHKEGPRVKMRRKKEKVLGTRHKISDLIK
jgi:hypothetical protein